jgi:hypothetical protein
MQGRSLLTGGVPSDQDRDDIYCEHYGTIHRQPGQPIAYATMLDRHAQARRDARL